MVKRVLQRAQAALTATALAVGIGCRDVASPDRENEREIDAAALDAGVGASPTGDPPIGPMSGEGTDPCLVGQLTVTTTSTGDVADLDAGYTIRLNRPSGPTQATGPNATVTFTALAEGTYEVFLDDVAGNCTVTSANPQTVLVPAGGTAQWAFTIDCQPSIVTVTGNGAIGGPAEPGSDRFDFQVNTGLGENVLITDYREVQVDGRVTTLTVNRTTFPNTRITSIIRTSPACVRFGGIARLNDPTQWELQFFIDACDNGSPGAGFDTFTLQLPEDPAYRRNGAVMTLTEGNLAVDIR